MFFVDIQEGLFIIGGYYLEINLHEGVKLWKLVFQKKFTTVKKG